MSYETGNATRTKPRAVYTIHNYQNIFFPQVIPFKVGELVFSWRSYPSGNLDKPDNVTNNSTETEDVNEYYGHEAVYYRDQLKGGHKVG